MTITVVRTASDGSLKNSKPCFHCKQLLVKLDFKKVIYTTDDNKIEIVKPKNLDSTHLSNSQMKIIEIKKFFIFSSKVVDT